MIKDLPRNITQSILVKYLSYKLGNVLDTSHIHPILSILLEEIHKSIKEDKELHIYNFGTLFLGPNPPRRVRNRITGEFKMSSGEKILRFKLTQSLKKIIRQFLDVDKTFGSD